MKSHMNIREVMSGQFSLSSVGGTGAFTESSSAGTITRWVMILVLLSCGCVRRLSGWVLVLV